MANRARILRRIAAAALLGAVVVLTALAGPSATAAGEECFKRGAAIRKTSLGAHQWTVRQRNRWCVARRAGRRTIVSVSRRALVETGTNWKLVRRWGGTRLVDRQTARSRSRFHLRLRYPHFEQNCRPIIRVTLRADGSSSAGKRVGC